MSPLKHDLNELMNVKPDAPTDDASSVVSSIFNLVQHHQKCNSERMFNFARFRPVRIGWLQPFSVTRAVLSRMSETLYSCDTSIMCVYYGQNNEKSFGILPNTLIRSTPFIKSQNSGVDLEGISVFHHAYHGKLYIENIHLISTQKFHPHNRFSIRNTFF